MSSQKIFRKISEELERLGGKSYEIAREAVLGEEKIAYRPLRKALKYFINIWRNVQHPALAAIACKAVGGEPEKTTHVGAALVLLTGAADIHDDIIDKSKMKGSKVTLYGRFGEDLSIIAGDVLFIEGLTVLNIACRNLPNEQGEIVQRLVKQGLFELGNAEAEETSLKGCWDLDPEKYFKIVKRKAVMAEVAARIGAIIGNANSDDMEKWGEIGRTLGMLMNIRDEFIDIFEAEELKNRRDNECLPLPMLYAMRDQKAREKLLQLLGKKELTNGDAMEIAEVVLETKEVKILKARIQDLINKEINQLEKYEVYTDDIELLKQLLMLTLEDL